MNVPFRLRPRSVPAATTAVWLASPDPRHLAGLCARLGGAWPEAFAVAGGFLVVTDDPPPAGLPRAVRLRRLAANLYLPADADLVPALHPAEAADLSRARGLLFLPDRVLAFDPGRPVAVAAVVAPVAVRRDAWAAFPPRPPRAERLVAIGYNGPSEPAAILDQGRPEGGSSPSAGDAGAAAGAASPAVRPPDAPPLRRATGRAAVALGTFLTWVGRSLGRPGLARAGADMIRRAVERVPRLTEKILGKQEATLRELLRRFQAGDVEGALRHAPAAATDNAGPARVDTGWTLGRQDPRYSLGALLGGGPVSIWLGGGDVWTQLAAEYRRIARDAADRGDHRRAAYVYGVLLHDLRLAADTLAAGGMHRDAAVLFRDRVNDPRAAALEFERAGDVDEALRLYRQTTQFERAADLLRRVGDEEGAVEMYVAAADRLARAGGWPAAGDLLRDRAGRTDLALAYYESGWQSQTVVALQCGERLLGHHVGGADWPALGRLLEDAADRLAPPARPADAGRFYAAVARAADRPVPDDLAADLRDRGRLALAVHLRAAGRKGVDVTDLFGHAAVWPAPVVRDATFAAHRQPPVSKEAPTIGPAVRLLTGPVTAAVLARGSFDVVLGSATGEVVIWRAADGRREPVTSQGGAVDAIAVDAEARRLVVTFHRVDGGGRLRSYARSQFERFQYVAERELNGTDEQPAWLYPIVRGYYGESIVDVVDVDRNDHLCGARLVPTTTGGVPHRSGHQYLLYESGHGLWTWSGRAITFSAATAATHEAERSITSLPWQPAVPEDSPLAAPPIDWINPEPRVLEVAGPAGDGVVYWSRASFSTAKGSIDTACSAPTWPGNFRAVAFLAAGRLVAVTAENEVVWWRVAGGRFDSFAPSVRLPVPARAVAAFARPTVGEVAVVFEDGTAVRLPVRV